MKCVKCQNHAVQLSRLLFSTETFLTEIVCNYVNDLVTTDFETVRIVY